MSTDWPTEVKKYWDAQPHPKAPGLTQAEFPVAVKLATAAKFGGHASVEEAILFWQEFKATGLSPEAFTHALDRLAPLSFAFHGRPPSMTEIKDLAAAKPADARRYFADLPDKDHPHVSAGEMVKALQAARPHFQEHLQRAPTKTEGAYLVHSNESAVEYARRLKAAKDAVGADGSETGTRTDGGGRGLAPPGGSKAE